MATPSNPFTGSGWSSTPTSNSMPGNALLFNNPSAAPPQQSNAMFAWPGQNVNQSFGASSGSSSSTPMFTAPNIIGGANNPGGLPELSTNFKDAARSLAYLDALSSAEKVQMAPQFANMMFSLAGPAGDYFKTLMNLGSPYYQAKQANVFDQGVHQNQNAAALAQQQLASRGYGYTPSGANAAMIGAMNTAGGANLVQNFLNSLFQNEQMQFQGAQGLSSLAGLFNPAPLMNVSVPGSNPTQGPSYMSDLIHAAGQAAGTIGAAFGVKPPCWIARAVYGEDSATAEHIRQRLLKLAATNPVYSALVATYVAVGEKVAERVKRIPALRKVFRSLFNQFLTDENKWPIGTFFNLLCAEGIKTC